MKAWDQPEVVEVSLRPSSQAVQPGICPLGEHQQPAFRPLGHRGLGAGQVRGNQADRGALAVDDAHPVGDVGGLQDGVVQRAHTPEPARVGRPDGHQPGNRVHPAGGQLGRGVRGAQDDESDAEPLQFGPRVDAAGQPRGWPRWCAAPQ